MSDHNLKDRIGQQVFPDDRKARCGVCPQFLAVVDKLYFQVRFLVEILPQGDRLRATFIKAVFAQAPLRRAVGAVFVRRGKLLARVDIVGNLVSLETRHNCVGQRARRLRKGEPLRRCRKYFGTRLLPAGTAQCVQVIQAVTEPGTSSSAPEVAFDRSERLRIQRYIQIRATRTQVELSHYPVGRRKRVAEVFPAVCIQRRHRVS